MLENAIKDKAITIFFILQKYRKLLEILKYILVLAGLQPTLISLDYSKLLN